MWLDIAILAIFVVSCFTNLLVLSDAPRAPDGRIERENMKPRVYVTSVLIQIVIIFWLSGRLLAQIGGG